MPIITCPHCGARRNTPGEKLPSKVTEARCPSCNQPFLFDPTPYLEDAPEIEARVSVTCPHCSLPREIPTTRQLDHRATVHCRRCRQPFRLKQGATISSAAAKNGLRQLTNIGNLLTDSWELFCQRGWGLLTTYLLLSLLIYAPLLLATLVLPQLVMGNRPLAWNCLAIGAAYGLLGSIWLSASMFNQICRQELGTIAALKRGSAQLWQFSWLYLLLGLLIGGGSLLLLVPGIIFTVWFFFSQFILAEEGCGALQALLKSRHLVRGHGWQVLGRLLLLLLVILAISTLTERLPVIGTSLNFTFSLLLTPFALLYTYRIYQELKRCQRQPYQPAETAPWLPLSTALLGLMLIPALLLLANTRQPATTAEFAKESSAIISSLFFLQQDELLEQAEQPREHRLPLPEPVSQADYNRLLNAPRPQQPQQGIALGPATLTAEQFWNDEQEPHLWLKLQLPDLPNLGLAQSRTARILIDQVLDLEKNNQYDQNHGFENVSFQWIDIHPSNQRSDGYGGIRNVYLKPGARSEQIRSISGQLELSLPLGIETVHLNRSDIGKTLQVAGQAITLQTLNDDRLALSFRGKRSQLLSIRAVNKQAEALSAAGNTWQQAGTTVNFKQMFSGDIDQITVLVASDAMTRRYPFEITR